MLTYGVLVKEVPLVREVILVVRIGYAVFNKQVLDLIANKQKISIAVLYKGEDLSVACADQRRVCYKVFRKKIDDISVTLAINSVFQLPYRSTFPMHAPSMEVHIMLESLSNLRKCVAGTQIPLGGRCRMLPNMLTPNDYVLFAGTNSSEEGGIINVSARLETTNVKAEGFTFCWTNEVLQELIQSGPGETNRRAVDDTTAAQDRKSTLSSLRQTPRRKEPEKQLLCYMCAPIALGASFDLKSLNSRLDQLLVQLESDGVVLVPMITRLKAGDCSTGRFVSISLTSHPYHILATTPIPLFSPDTVVKVMNGSINEHAKEHSLVGWDRCATNTFNYLLDKAVFIGTSGATRLKLDMDSATRLHKCVLNTCQAVCSASTFAFYAAQYAVEIIEEEVLGPTAGVVLIGSLTFDRSEERKAWQDGNNDSEGPDKEENSTKDREEGPRLATPRPTVLNASRNLMDKWRDRFYFRKLPSEHPLRIFALFKNDQLFVTQHTADRPSTGFLLAILVLGDEKVDMEEASKLYGIEIQAQQMFNNEIVALKSHRAERDAGGVSAKNAKANRLTTLTTVLMTAVDYKGFRVVVLPLPECMPTVVAWPQPLSARIRHEITFLESKLNLCNLLKPVSPENCPDDVTILLSLKSNGADTMMLYRTCYVLPHFSGKDGSNCQAGIAQRLRTIPFKFSTYMEESLKQSQHISQQNNAKPACPPNYAYRDPIVTSPFSRLYAPADELIHFLTSKFRRPYRDNVEPIVCGRVPPGRQARRLGAIVKSVILDDAVVELEKMNPYGPYDSISLTNHLHRRGINMRLLGAMYKKTRAQWLQHMIMVEIVARTLKQLLKEVIRRLVFSTNSDLEATGVPKASEKVDSLMVASGREQEPLQLPDSDSDGGSVTSDDSIALKDLLRGNDRIAAYSKQSLLREAFLPLPLFVSSRLLDDSPYLLDLTKQKFRTFFWTDIVLLNMFNVAIGCCSESEEFWRGFLCYRCSKLYGVEASVVRKSRVYLPALYVALQHHCGISFFPCTATISSMLDRPFPLMPSHIRAWMPKLFRSVVVPNSLPVISLVQDPSRIPLVCTSKSALIQSPSPAQTVLSRLVGHAIIQCSHPLWHASKELGKDVNASTIASMYSTTQGHPLLIAQESWDVEEATVELIGVALRYESWDVAHLLAQKCIVQYPESHAASVPARLLLLLAATHGSAEPPPTAQLAAIANRIQRVLEFHWGGHHPAALDVTVAQAWISYLGRDWKECVSILQAAVSLCSVLSVSLRHEDLTSLKKLLAVTATDEASKIPAGIPPAPITPKMASLLRMLAHSKLVLLYGRRNSMRREFMPREQITRMTNSASLMLQWALDAYDFHFGARHELTMAAAREFALSLLLLLEPQNDAGSSILQRGVEIAFQTLEWQVIILGKCHLETLATGRLLAILLANQGRYRRCIDIYEAVIRNAFTRLTQKPSLRRYRPDNEFSRVCWCLPDPYFYGIFETVSPANRFFSKVRLSLQHLHDDMALLQLEKDTIKTENSPKEPPFAVTTKASLKPEPPDAEPVDSAPKAPPQVSKTNMIQLDPSDHSIFPNMQAKAASDMVSPSIPDLVGDMFVVYINFALDKNVISRIVTLFLLLDYIEKQNFKAVSYDVFELAYTKSGGDVDSHSFLTWLVDLSSTSEVQVMEYIEHYSLRIPKENLFDQDSDLIFLLCHPGASNIKAAARRDCIMDRYLVNLLSKSEAAVSNALQLILSGSAKQLSDVAQACSSPLEKLQRAVSKLRVIFVMLRGIKEKNIVEDKVRAPEYKELFKRHSLEQWLPKQEEEQSIIKGKSFEQPAEIADEGQTEMRMRLSKQLSHVSLGRRYRRFLAHMRTSLRLPANARCSELDILANLLYYYLDVKTFRTWWQKRYPGGLNSAKLISTEKIEAEKYPPLSAFEEY